MIALLAIHLGTNYLAVRAVSMRTLNRQRANLVLSNCLAQYPVPANQKSTQSSKVKIPTPDAISLKELVFERDGVLRGGDGAVLGFCQLGVNLQIMLRSFGSENNSPVSHSDDGDIRKLIQLFQDDAYILWYDRDRNLYLIVLKHGCSPRTHLIAWAHALMTAASKDVTSTSSTESIIHSLGESKARLYEFLNVTDLFSELEKAGWDLDTGAMETRSGTRCQLKAE